MNITMKTFTAILLFAAIMGYKMEADAGSFNLSGSFDPGISFGRSSLIGRNQIRNVEDDDDDSYWPQPNHINKFEEPESFKDPIPNEGSNDYEHPQAHHHGPHHRAHRH